MVAAAKESFGCEMTFKGNIRGGFREEGWCRLIGDGRKRVGERIGEDGVEEVRSLGVTTLGCVSVRLRGAGTEMDNGSLEGCETDGCCNMVTGMGTGEVEGPMNCSI